MAGNSLASDLVPSVPEPWFRPAELTLVNPRFCCFASSDQGHCLECSGRETEPTLQAVNQACGNQVPRVHCYDTERSGKTARRATLNVSAWRPLSWTVLARKPVRIRQQGLQFGDTGFRCRSAACKASSATRRASSISSKNSRPFPLCRSRRLPLTQILSQNERGLYTKLPKFSGQRFARRFRDGRSSER